jgi:aminomethyltransferase
MFRFTEPGIPRPGHAVLSDGDPVATVTSGTLSPTLGVGIGMAYLPTAIAAPGNPIAIDVRGSAKSAVTARRPLVDTSPKESS